MKAGRELDALVAEKVMGWPMKDGEVVYRTPNGNAWFDAPPGYSTDIAAAWGLVEKMQRNRFVCEITADCFDDGSPAGFEAAFWNGDADGWGHDHHEQRVHADTAPLAICIAALKAVGAEVP